MIYFDKKAKNIALAYWYYTREMPRIIICTYKSRIAINHGESLPVSTTVPWIRCITIRCPFTASKPLSPCWASALIKGHLKNLVVILFGICKIEYDSKPPPTLWIINPKPVSFQPANLTRKQKFHNVTKSTSSHSKRKKKKKQEL